MKHPRARDAHRPQILPVFLSLVVCLALAPVTAFCADATIGIYGDTYGASCSLAGNNVGMVSAYVFVNPGSVGVRSVRFSAPIPSCFDATFVGETAPGGIITIGSSQTGISISSGVCEPAPFQVLQITYFANGGTTPCCPYPILADPFTGALEAIGCSYESIAISGPPSYLNANAACPCGTAPPTFLPPAAPFNPLPVEGTGYVALNTQLRWSCSDPQGFGMTSDVYFGTSSTPPLIATDVPSSNNTIFSPGLLLPGTTYFWRIVVRSSAQLETSGPVWYFSTGANGSPSVQNTAPVNGAVAVPDLPTLTWHAFDPDGDPMTYDVYLGTSPSPPFYANKSGAQSFTVTTPLAFSTRYYWRIVATDSGNRTGTSDVWTFITRAENEQPPAPANPYPPNGSAAIPTAPTLTWSESDASLTYDVYFGQKLAPSGAATVGLYVDSYGSSCSFSGNNAGLVNVYVVARPGAVALREVGLTVTIPACFDATYIGEDVADGFGWQGTSQTGISLYPSSCMSTPFSALQITYMSNGAAPCCAWSPGPQPDLGHIEARDCSYVETAVGGITSHLNADASCACTGVFDLPKVATDLTEPSYPAGQLLLQTAYQWRVVARNAQGLERSSPYWSFTTIGNQPPIAPFNPSPASGAVGQSEFTTLSWTSLDPEGQAITYDVYFGTALSPPLVASNLTTASYNPGPQSFSTLYRWRIVARDASGLTTSGPLWTYTTKVTNLPPGAPTVVSPANGATNQPLNAALAWNASDLETPDALKFDVYFGKATASASGSSIGLYTDASGSTCSFSGNLAGMVTAYVIVKPDAVGIRGVRFSAPVPGCFGGAYVGEIVPASLVSIGTSQAGISVATPVCLSQPFQVLQILYLANGGTTPCCEYPVLPDPFIGHLEAVDCAYEDTPLNTMLSHFNAGPSCPCGEESLALVASNISAKSFQPGLMDVSSTYRWRVLARDPFGLETLGQTWSFTTTSDPNLPPLAPSNPNPVVGAQASRDPLLTWQCSDPDNDALSYTITVTSGFGPPIVGHTTVAQFSPGLLAPGTVYFWYVTASDGHWTTTGPTWSFQTSGGETPVLFSRFDVAPQRDGVEIRWKLSSDEPMERYTLYRREGANGTPAIIAAGRVTGTDDSYYDTTAERGKTYGYQLLIRATSGDEFRSTFATATMPQVELALYQNQPNPFNPQTTIRYDLPAAAPTHVKLMIVDTTGRRVRMLVDETQAGGARSAMWNGRDDSGQTVASGVYFYALEVGKDRLTRKLVLLK